MKAARSNAYGSHYVTRRTAPWTVSRKRDLVVSKSSIHKCERFRATLRQDVVKKRCAVRRNRLCAFGEVFRALITKERAGPPKLP